MIIEIHKDIPIMNIYLTYLI